MTVDQFIAHCQSVISDYDAGKLLVLDAGRRINNDPMAYPFRQPVHPMIKKIANLAFDIGEDYRSPEAQKEDWDMLVQTVQRYIKGDWEPTNWLLMCTYSAPSHSYSVAVRRRNGKTTVETALPQLQHALKAATAKVNTDQTDEHYLRNLALFLPPTIDTLKLISFDVAEHLTQPHHTTTL